MTRKKKQLTFSVGSNLLSTVTFFRPKTLSFSCWGAQDLLKALVMSPNAALFAVTSFRGLSAFRLFGTFRLSLWFFREANCLLLVLIPCPKIPFMFSLTQIGFDANLVGAIIVVLLKQFPRSRVTVTYHMKQKRYSTTNMPSVWNISKVLKTNSEFQMASCNVRKWRQNKRTSKRQQFHWIKTHTWLDDWRRFELFIDHFHKSTNVEWLEI